MNLRHSAILSLGLILSACGQSEPRSTQYFEANLDEARKVVADCRAGSTRGDECTNADVAGQTVEGRERFKRFLGKD